MHFLSEYFLIFALLFGAFFFWFGRQGQKFLLLAASYFFCGSQNWMFAALLIASTLLNHSAATAIQYNPAWRQHAMWAGIAANVAILGVFKYFNFFSVSFSEGLGAIGVHYAPVVLDLAIPLGLSFYTLQAISYLIDLRDGKVARADLLDLAVYVAFWPKFVAGPIIRAKSFLPQLRTRRRFTWPNFYLGIESIIYGLFLKTTLSDYLAPQVNKVYAAPYAYDGADSFLAVLFFTFQIYGDFAGYSLVVIGIARILGYSVQPNFRRPNFAQSFSDFWSRWHISLSSWLEDYIFRRLRVRTSARGAWKPASVAEIYSEIFGLAQVSPGQTFAGLAGDSLSFVQVALALEDYLGEAPEGWERMSIGQLEERKASCSLDRSPSSKQSRDQHAGGQPEAVGHDPIPYFAPKPGEAP